jgi:hypothetical protein
MEFYIVYILGSFFLFFLWLLSLKRKDTIEKKNQPIITQNDLDILYSKLKAYPFNPTDEYSNFFNFAPNVQLKKGYKMLKEWEFLMKKYDVDTCKKILCSHIWTGMSEVELNDMVCLLITKTNFTYQDKALYNGTMTNDLQYNHFIRKIELSNDKKGNVIRTFVYGSKNGGNYFKFIDNKLESFKFRDVKHFSGC